MAGADAGFGTERVGRRCLLLLLGRSRRSFCQAVLPGRRCGLTVRAAGVGGCAVSCLRLVAGDGAGDDAAGGRAVPFAAQVTVGLQLTQGGGDTGRALGESGGERLDVGARTGGQ